MVNIGLLSFLPIYTALLLLLGQDFTPPSPTSSAPAEESTTNPFRKNLQLTPEQTTKLGAIEKQYKNQATTQLLQEINQAEKELNEMMMGTAPASQLRERQQQLVALKLRAGAILFDESLAMREVLTPVQRRQLGKSLSRW